VDEVEGFHVFAEQLGETIFIRRLEIVVDLVEAAIYPGSPECLDLGPVVIGRSEHGVALAKAEGLHPVPEAVAGA
jgi:hypothetical protein